MKDLCKEILRLAAQNGKKANRNMSTIFNYKEDNIHKLSRGEVPLRRVFWLYGFLIPLVLIILEQLIVSFVITPVFGAEAAFYTSRYVNLFVIIPYTVLFGCVLVPTAIKYKGSAVWKLLSYIAIPLVFITCGLLAYAELSLLQMGYEDVMALMTQWDSMIAQ